MKYKRGLFIFRRDFRILDNTALNSIAAVCKEVYTVFIFTPEQITDKNKYKSDKLVRFMIECLADLSNIIKKHGGRLYTLYGTNPTVISDLIKKLSIDCIAFNADYTPYALARDKEILHLCREAAVDVIVEHDYNLYTPGTIKNTSHMDYRKFTPYYTATSLVKIRPPSYTRITNFGMDRVASSHIVDLAAFMPKLVLQEETVHIPQSGVEGETPFIPAGRAAALLLLKKTSIRAYQHDEPAIATTGLSSYIKFGCISIREAWTALKKILPLARQLVWRDFYANVLYAYPTYVNRLQWENNPRYINKWKEGKTGFPLVDAGMRQMNATGYMHNRARLITASFLCKTLLVDWRIGERYFATQLIDYDWASNNGNWQWVAGTGTDSQPYYRIFNPWLQSKDHDRDAVYIKRWIPELKLVPARDIHQWYDKHSSHTDINYPAPIVDFSTRKELALKMYKK